MFEVKVLAVKILLIMTGINLSNKAELGIKFFSDRFVITLCSRKYMIDGAFSKL